MPLPTVTTAMRSREAGRFLLLPGGFFRRLANCGSVSSSGTDAVGFVQRDVTVPALGRYSTYKQRIASVGALRWRAIGRHESRDAPKVKAREL